LIGELLHYSVLVPWLLGMVFGIFVGATPGLTATMAVALIVPISFHLQSPTAGLAMIVGVSFTAIFAGDIPATYLRIPGTPASAAATLDGHQMARQGRGGLAMTLDLFCSSIGGLIGVGLLIAVAPQLARFALQFSFYEKFWLAVFGLSLSALVSAGSTVKGLMAACLGMLLATVGMDIVSGVPRYSFGSVNMMSGLDFIPVMIGLFGLSEVFRHVSRPLGALQDHIVSGRDSLPFLEALRLIWRHKVTVLQSSVVGTVIGALPGAGADIAAWGAYGLAQKTTRRGPQFGTGVVEGVVAPTSANNAAVAGAWIPALVFGVPGDAVTAIVLGALMMYDIKPGPQIFVESRHQMQALFAVALITQVLLLIAGLAGIKAFGAILRLPRSVVLTGVVVFSVVGSYALNNSLFDLTIMLIFGVVGYLLESQRVPLAPLILGLILGPMVEENLRVGLINSDGSYVPFFTRPICAVLVALLLVTYVGLPAMKRLLRWKSNRAAA
jgi:putative tricarboxylic transport membrane protein